MHRTFDDENLQKHGVSRQEVLEVLESDLSFAEEMTSSDRGNDRALVIGWTYCGKILELGIEYFDDVDREHIFHAMKAGPKHRQEFARRLRSDL